METTVIDGVAYATIDGQTYRVKDILELNNPGISFDVMGRPAPAEPPKAGAPEAATPRRDYQFGDVGAASFREAVDNVKSLAGSGGEATRSMLPESWRQSVPDGVLAAGDYGLAGLAGLLGAVETGAGYGAEVVNGGVEGLQKALGIQPRYAAGDGARALQRDLMGMFDAAGALPEGRMLGAMYDFRRGPTPIPDAAAALTRSRQGVYNIGDRLLHAGDGASYIPATNKPGLLSLPDDPTKYEARPIGPIEEAAQEYMRKRGVADFKPLTEYPAFSEDRARAVAMAYDAMKHDPSDPLVRRAYDAMIQETLDQYNALRDTGIDFRFLKEGMSDPYARSPALGYRDMVENGRLWVFPTDFGFGTSAAFDPSTNPLLTRVGKIGDKADAVANDAFRAVHDAYGHFGPGNPFFRHQGEERAWVEHSRMYSPEARGAMTSETRGQNSWLNFGPHGDANRKALGADTIFADQKSGLMPDWTYGLLSPEEELAAIEEFLRMRGVR